MEKEERIKNLTDKITNLRSEINRLVKEKEQFETELNTKKEKIKKWEQLIIGDSTKTPSKLYRDLKNEKRTKIKIEKEIYKINKVIYGTFNNKPIGLIYKHDVLEEKLRYLKTPDKELIERIRNENANEYLNKIKLFINQILNKFNSKVVLEENILEDMALLVIVDHILDDKITTEPRTDKEIEQVVIKLLTAKGYIKQEILNLNPISEDNNKSKIKDLSNKFRIILRDNKKFDKLINLPQKDRASIMIGYLRLQYPEITDEQINNSRLTIERYIKDGRLSEFKSNK